MKINRNISKLNRKSQTTIFMILGLIILLGGVLFFYLTQRSSSTIEPELKIVQEQVPVEFDPIRKYANDCALSTGLKGLKIIGKQGGYISFSNRTLNKEPFTITQNPTESDAVVFAQGSDLEIPYWWYLKSTNDCRDNCMFASKRPDLRETDNSIEKQLERYIDAEFKECLDNFAPFEAQGFVISEEGPVKSDVIIGVKDVTLVVDYPIKAQREDRNSKITQYLVTIPVNLDKVYDLATKITNLEIKHNYLEKHALNLIVAFSGVNTEKLPPMSDLQFKFGSTTSWQKTDVKNKIAGMLASYIPLFQVDGTYNYDRNLFDSDLKQKLYDSTIIPVANSSFRDVAAYFNYLDFWPVYFDLNCKGERCEPSSANSLISFFGIQQYRFSYDVSFPVLVEIKDPFALNGQGYTFNLFLEGNVRNNKPMPGNFSPLERATFSERTLLCDIRTSGNITLNVNNLANNNPVEDAQVLYRIIDESCYIGSTDKDGMMSEKFPVGVGGLISVLRDSYVGKAVEFNPSLDEDAKLKVDLAPIYTKKLVIQKKNVVKTQDGWQFIDVPIDLSEKETATVTLNRISKDNELEFSTIGSLEGSAQDATIDIAPGTYSAEGNLLLNQKIVIPEKKKCVKKNIFGAKECYTIPKVDFAEKAAPGEEKFPEGGLKLNFTIKAKDLENHGTIVFYLVSADIAGIPEPNRVIEDIEQMNKIEQYSKTYQAVLQPAFK